MVHLLTGIGTRATHVAIYDISVIALPCAKLLRGLWMTTLFNMKCPRHAGKASEKRKQLSPSFEDRDVRLSDSSSRILPVQMKEKSKDRNTHSQSIDILEKNGMRNRQFKSDELSDPERATERGWAHKLDPSRREEPSSIHKMVLGSMAGFVLAHKSAN